MRKVDATSGPLFKSIVRYTIPLIIASIVQELFVAVDKAVLGNMADTTAVAAVGVSGALTGLLTAGFIGISSGVAIVLARYIGQRDSQSAKNSINTALISSLLFGLIIVVVGWFLSPAFLKAIDCPAECYEPALLYVRIFFAASPIMLFYNYGASVLRTLGDTKSPLAYIMIGGAVNVVLNILLCLLLSEKVAAVAIATAVSNLISAVLVLIRLLRFEGDVRISLREIRFNTRAFVLMIKFGIPTAISSLIIPLANIQIAAAMNSFGVDAVAGNSAAVTIQLLICSFHSSLGVAAMVFMGQNIGAKNPQRVRKSFSYCLWSALIVTGVLSVLSYVTGEFCLGLILGMDATAAIEYGMMRIIYVNLFAVFLAVNGVLASALQAYGYPFLGSVSSLVFTLGFRTLWMSVVYKMCPTYAVVMQCFTVSITLNMIFYIVVFSIVHSRYKRGIYKEI